MTKLLPRQKKCARVLLSSPRHDNGYIANELGWSRKYAKKVMHEIYQATGVDNKLGLISLMLTSEYWLDHIFNEHRCPHCKGTGVIA